MQELDRANQDQIMLDRDSFSLLLASAQAILPTLVARQSPRVWALSEAIKHGEQAVLHTGMD